MSSFLGNRGEVHNYQTVMAPSSLDSNDSPQAMKGSVRQASIASSSGDQTAGGLVLFNIRKVGPFIKYPILHYLYVPKYLQKSLLILSKEKIASKIKSYLLSRKLVLAIFVLLFAPQKNKI